MNLNHETRVLVLLSVVFSLALLSGSVSSAINLPSLQVAHAIPQPCETKGSAGACSEFWYPAGPSMNTIQASIYGSSTCEFDALTGSSCFCPDCVQTAPALDLPDSPLPSNLVASFNSSQQTYVTPLPVGGYYGYLRCQTAPCSPSNSWIRVINGANAGLSNPNYFTWLNAWNPAPAIPGTIRQGFAETTRSVNPFIASTVWDTYIVNEIYDSLYQPNPLSSSQFIDWMTVSTQQLSNSSLTYAAPAHTLTTYRFTLRSDMFFQDGNPVTSYDAAFSYLSMVGSGAFLGTGASPMSGITVLNPHQFDIGVSSVGPFVLPNLTSIPILPGRYWTNAGTSSWDSAVMTCTVGARCSLSQYTLSGATVNCALNCSPFNTALMTVNPAYASATFDPIAAGILIGSGPWECISSTYVLGKGCTTTGNQNPPLGDGYTLTRYGNRLAPVSSISGIYSRSSGDLALYIWSEENDINPILPFAEVASCLDQPVNLNGPCAHWQQGFGNDICSIGGGGCGGGKMVGITQVSVVSRFYNVNWIAPYEWQTNPPTGIGALPPVLYEGSVTLNPSSVAGCPNGYDC